MPTFTEVVTLNTLHCSHCNVLFAITADFEKRARQKRTNFYCPNGHSQWYPGKTEKELRQDAERRLASAQEDVRILRARITKAEAEAKRQAKRTAGGVCPCCNRSFVQLARHMKSQHPDHGK